MKIAFDCNAMVKLSRPDDDVALWRLQYLLQDAATIIVLPTPSIAEFLVRLNQAESAWLTSLDRKKNVVVASFDRRAAAECAALEKMVIKSGQRKASNGQPWQKVKIDRQIIAIARVHGCDQILSNDGNLVAMAQRLNIRCQDVSDLPLPPEDPQGKLSFEVGLNDHGPTGPVQ